eukprot:SAG31_NODE_10432_length_1139_cov_2.400000_2_plen_187_part_00
MPLDPEYPEQRALTILEDSGTRVVVAQEGVCAWAGGSSVGGTVVVMVQESGVIMSAGSALKLNAHHKSDAGKQSHDADPARSSGGGDICYVLYTSGSTGKPKGVVLEHRNVVHFVNAFLRVFPLEQSCRVPYSFAFVFDGHVLNVYPTFASGGTLCTYPKSHLLEHMDATLSEEKITAAAARCGTG